MSDRSRDRQIASHIKSISARAEPDTERLVSAMLGRCWPGDSGDRSEPGALEWLRRWGPRGVEPTPLVCSCAAGRCRVCN
jgi:hypothetical protein